MSASLSYVINYIRAKKKEERARIVQMAAHIILQVIRTQCYDTKNYKAPSSFLDDILSDIPPSLKLFWRYLGKIT